MAHYTELIPDDGRMCPNCWGFGRAAVTVGTRHDDGSRTIVFANCIGCNGLGWLPLQLIADVYDAATARRAVDRVL